MSSKYVPIDDKSLALQPEPAPRQKRFFKAICVAAGIYILSSLFVKCLPRVTDLWRVQVANDDPWGPRQGDGQVLRCAGQEWDVQPESMSFPGFPHTSKVSFEIPASSDHIFFFSRGSYGHGAIRTELSDLPDDKIEVEIVASYYSIEARNHVNVCHLEREKYGQGVGIYTPQRHFGHPHRGEQIAFDVIIRFPRSGSSKNPLVINSLETDMGIWRHDIEALENRVVFNSLSLSGSNAKINVDSISAESVKARTSNSGITGSYNVSDSLTLKTSNAPITVALRMENKNGQNPTRVDMTTSNARLESSIRLFSAAKSSSASPPSFSVVGKTSNSPITISFLEAPSSPFSHLSLKAKTSNSNAYTKLHPTYEGTISLRSSIFSPSIQQKSRPDDPSGGERRRHLDIRSVMRNVLDANVWWGDDENKGEGKGSVFVTTSNAHNTVDLN